MNVNTRRLLKTALSLLGAAVLASCGGGDGDGGGSGVTAAQLSSGLWVGSTDTNRNVTAVTLSDGRYYVFYDKVATPGTAGGLLEGTDSNLANSFTITSTGAKDYNLESVPGPVSTTVAVRGDVVPRTTLNATMSRGNGTGFNFNTNYDADFNGTPSLSTIQGTYTGTVTFSLGPRAGVFVVDANGGITSTINGCSITGQLTPRTDGNIYNLSITFGPSPCVFPSQTLNGIAYYRAATHELRTASTGIATVNPAIIPGDQPSDEGVVFIGTKP